MMGGVICTKRVYFHTNVVVPYRFRQYEQIAQVFPNSWFVLNGEMDYYGDSVWEQKSEDKINIRYIRIASQNTKTSGKGRAFFSPRLLWLLITQPWGSYHVMGAGISGLNLKMLLLSGLIGHSKLIWMNDGCVKADAMNGPPGFARRFLVNHILKATWVNFGWGKERALRCYGFKDKNIINQFFSCDDEKYDRFRAEEYASERKCIRSELKIAEDTVCFICVARWVDCKRLIDLGLALKYVEERYRDVADKCHVIMIGGGEDRSHIKTFESLKIIKVNMLQPMSADAVMSYYAASDVFVLPSEGDVWGVVVNEAMTMGLPVICTSEIGASILIKDNLNGFVVKPRCPEAIATHMAKIISDRKILQELSCGAIVSMRDWRTIHGVEALATWIEGR